MGVFEKLIATALDDDEAYVRRYCPNVEFRITGGRARYMITLRPGDPGAIASNDIGAAWRMAADAVRREQEGRE